MANTISRVQLNDPSATVNYVLKVAIEGDGSGEETATRLNVASADLGSTPKIMAIKADLVGFSAKLLWDATTDIMAFEIPDSSYVDHDFYHEGGLPNNAGSGKTGDLLITTTGLGSADAGWIEIHFRKV